jgi:uncharacterized membrane protein
MEKMLVVVVDSESKAYEASRALTKLDVEGSISIYALAVIAKTADGKISVKEAGDEFPIGLAEGTAIGALIGLLGGPIGFAVGTAAGSLAGGISDLYVADVDAEFVDDVATKLTAGKSAVIADLSEDWVTPVDTQMERFGGTVIRTLTSTFEADQRAKKVATMRAEIEQLKAEQARADAELKAKLQARIDKLNTALESQLNQVRQRSAHLKKESEAKVRALQKKAAAAHSGAQSAFHAEVERIRQGFEDTDAKLRQALAGKLRATATKIEKEPAASHR